MIGCIQGGLTTLVNLIDTTVMNIGIRIKSSQTHKKALLGAWVIFDFGGLDPKCFNRVTVNALGKKLSLKNRVEFYRKKVTVI